MPRRIKLIKRAVRRPFEWMAIGLAWLVLTHLPHKAMLACCDFASAIGWLFDSRGKALSRENLRIVLGRTLPPAKERLIIRRSYRNMMRTLGHIFWTSRNAAVRAKSVGELSPSALILASTRPAIALSGHLGCWEVLSQLVYLLGIPIISVAKNIGTPGMTNLLMRGRRSLGQKVIPADGAFRPLYAALREGSYVGLLIDQVVRPADGGVWVKYFGRPVPVSVAPAFLCAKTHAPVFLAWCRPLKDGRYRCEVISTYRWEKGMDVWRRTQEIIRDLERTIRRHPSCWVLNYRYFRKTPTDAELQQLEKRMAGFNA